MVRVEKFGRAPSDAEVPEKPTRRRFSTEYKLKILKEADACESGSGEFGSLLRREGLYSSHLLTRRRQHDEGSIAALEPKKRDPATVEIERLKREVTRLQQRLEQA